MVIFHSYVSLPEGNHQIKPVTGSYPSHRWRSKNHPIPRLGALRLVVPRSWLSYYTVSPVKHSGF